MTTHTPLVVVGVDGSECAREALRVAVDEARYRGARLHVVAAWSVPVMMYAGGYVGGVDPGTFERAAEIEAANAVEEAHRLAPDLEVVGDVSKAAPAPALIAASEHADLLVVGSRGLGGFERLLLGSVSQHVATHAACPVLVVRSHPA
jgi:nucleotide-binding universal stress UspA family protein